MPKKTDQATLDLIVAEYKRTGSAVKAARAYGSSSAVCLRELSRRGEVIGPPGRKKSSATMENAVADYYQGKTFKHIQNVHDISKSALYATIRNRGLAYRRNMRPAEVEALLAIYKTSQDVDLAAVEFGLDREQCRRILANNGFVVPRSRDVSPESLEIALTSYLDGMTYKEVKERFGVPMRPIAREIKKRGLSDEAHEAHRIKVSAAIQQVSVEQWKGFACPENHRQFTIAMKKWRSKVVKRDGKKCMDCGSTRALQAHHIFPKGRFPQLAEEVANGITLCRKCHSAIRHKEMEAAQRYLSHIGSTIFPVTFYEKGVPR